MSVLTHDPYEQRRTLHTYMSRFYPLHIRIYVYIYVCEDIDIDTGKGK